MHYELLSDLALILAVAGVVSVVFKRLKQPVVLGYIVAGFLAGPHMPYTPTVDDVEGINLWSEIGVIFIMFSLGLEFSFKKILKLGISPILCALCIMTCMIGIGSLVGGLFGWSSMNRLFLGGMLAMSSTTIIYKAFDDLGLRQRKFVKSVMSVLILEDILGIVLMVMLSAMAVTRTFEGTAMVMSLVKLAFILSLWFLVGIYVVPLFFRKNSNYINSETLLVMSIGLCFLLVILATKAGYSAAFGAFMMGSILAETVEAERIEAAVCSVKDLFGAIFFVSVGMLVDPAVIVEYWLPILVIVLSILVGQSIFGTMSYILSGQNLRDALQSGFAMAQIGEFAFIIASLGVSLKVTDAYLYPIVVAVSIITTFLTPYMIKLSQRLSEGETLDAMQHMMKQFHVLHTDRAVKVDTPILSYVVAVLHQTAGYYVLTLAAITLSLASFLPFCRSVFTHWPGNAICGVVTLILISLFLRPVIMRKHHSVEARRMCSRGKAYRIIFYVLFLVRYALATWAVYYLFDYLSPYRWYWHLLLSIGVVFLILRSRGVKYYSIRMERTFRHNLTRRDRHYREALEDRRNPRYGRRLRGRDLHIVRLTLPDNTMWGGKRLMELKFGREDNVILVAVLRGEHRINLPDGHTMLFPRDVIEVVGDDASIEAFSARMETECMEWNDQESELSLQRIVIDSDSPFLGKTILESHIRRQLSSIVIGNELQDGTLSIATADYVFRQGDIIWLVG